MAPPTIRIDHFVVGASISLVLCSRAEKALADSVGALRGSRSVQRALSITLWNTRRIGRWPKTISGENTTNAFGD
jgi:hypothetical protein